MGSGGIVLTVSAAALMLTFLLLELLLLQLQLLLLQLLLLLSAGAAAWRRGKAELL